ncbi:hypothetical protein RND81_02G083500 [Saponaria officinalis]|uniref:Uncharacterized protein n=1 Tax=Saponaria officinalis TaxID=3572 RepID=A0AAW1MSM1_SAPOF
MPHPKNTCICCVLIDCIYALNICDVIIIQCYVAMLLTMARETTICAPIATWKAIAIKDVTDYTAIEQRKSFRNGNKHCNAPNSFSSRNYGEWIIDSGASSHITPRLGCTFLIAIVI